MIHRRTHPEYVMGCNPCKWATVAIFAVEGGHRAQSTQGRRQMERDLQRYRDKRQAGEHPRSIQGKGMDKSAKLEDTWSTNEKQIRDDNSPEAVKAIKKTLLNQ